MKSILVVDDNAVNRALVSTYIKREGYRVIQAADGMCAVEMAIAEKPDLILMDLDMPEMDGWEAARRIRSESGLSKIPIVALTGFKGQKNITDAVSAGFSGYETKPILFSRLAERVNGFLGSPQPETNAEEAKAAEETKAEETSAEGRDAGTGQSGSEAASGDARSSDAASSEEGRGDEGRGDAASGEEGSSGSPAASDAGSAPELTEQAAETPEAAGSGQEVTEQTPTEKAPEVAVTGAG